MRLLISLLLIGLIACAEQPKGFTFKLRGDFINVDTATVNVLSPEDEVLLSTRMKDGKFVLQGTLPGPGYYAIDMGNQRKVKVMLDAPDMYWPSDYNMVDARYVKNSPGTKSMLDILGVVRETCTRYRRGLFMMSITKRLGAGIYLRSKRPSWKSLPDRNLLNVERRFWLT